MSPAPILLVVACHLAKDEPAMDSNKGIDSFAKPELTWWYGDADGDGFGDPLARELAEIAPAGMVLNRDDCNDYDATVFPGANEHCDSRDEDCDDRIDEGAVDQTSGYADRDIDGYGDGAAVLSGCEGSSEFVLVSGDCDDADPQRNPGENEVCEDNLDNDCDGRDARCRPQGSKSMAEAEVRMLGYEEGDVVGQFLSMGPDVTGDGHPDILIGATQQFGHSEDLRAGGAYLLGDIPVGEAVLEDVAVRIWGEEYRWGGWSVQIVPDLNGDPYGEVVLSAARYGETCIFSGPIAEDLLRSDADACFTREPDITTSFGLIASYVGDQNEDGVGDLAVSGGGNIYHDGWWYTDVGRVYLFFGPHSGTIDGGQADARLMPNVANNRLSFGRSLCSGDVNGDGVSDLMVSGPADTSEFVEPHIDGGLVYAILGPMRGDISLDDGAGHPTGADGLWQGERSDANAGIALSCGGDANGDGRDDVLVGAPGWLVDTATTHLLLNAASGDHSLAEADWTLESADSWLGAYATLDSDLDGDGLADMAISNLITDREGEILLYYGGQRSGREGLGGEDALLSEENTDDTLGPVAGGQDLNDDGFEDLLLGAPGYSTASTTWVGATYLLYGGLPW